MDGSAFGLDGPIARLKRRYDALKGTPERTNVESHCQDIAEVVSPRKVTFTGYKTPGTKRMTQVFDSTGIHANELLASGLHGMATNPATKWFSLRVVGETLRTEDGKTIDINELPEVKQYLNDVEEIMWQRLYQPGTNFTNALHECYLDLGAFGTAILFVGQRDNGALLFQDRPLAECLIAENHEGRVDTVFRATTYTVRQLKQMEKSGENREGWTLSDKVQQMANENRWEEQVLVVHAVYPRVERDPTAKGSDNMPWASCYFEHETCHELEMGGFPEFPYLVSRWSKYSGEVYGRSPAMTALPDIKMLQAMELAKVKLLQKAADPPMWLRSDGVVGQTRTIPGGISYWRGNPNDGVMLQPVSLQGIQALMEDMIAVRERILRTFFADIMRMVDRANMTATEVMQRTSEQMRLFGPMIGRLESEMLGPLVERVFGIMNRMNLLPPPPDVISEKEFTIEYVSPIATAQKQQAVNGMVQALQMFLMLGPEVAGQVIMKNLDVDKTFRDVWDLFNNKPDLLRSEEDVAQASQQEQAQQALAMGQPAAEMLQKGAGAVESLSRANSAGNPDGSGGMDFGQFLAQLQEAVARNPRAQEEIRSMMNGQMPSPAAIGA